MNTLRDVFEKRDDLLKKLDSTKERFESMSPYDSSKMDSVLIFPDKVAKTFFEINYVFNTHFVPNGLPASGEAIGDFLEHEDKTYLTMHFGAMISNLMAFHLIRPSEPLYREWFERRDEFDRRVQNLLAEIHEVDEGCFGIKAFQGSDKWNESYVGWSYLGTPSTGFLDALKSMPEKCGSVIIKTATILEAELEPYTVLQKVMDDIRDKAHHKGFPRVQKDMLYLPTPAASGGASIHTHWASDDVQNALPSSSDLMIIAAQAGTIGVAHIGAGRVEGKHIIFVPPKTPFLKAVQEKISSSSDLQIDWDELTTSDVGLAEIALKWVDTTKSIKDEVIKEVVPDLVSCRVLGFQIDLKSEYRVANLRPVIAESLLEKEKDVIDEYGCQVIEEHITDVLLETSDSFGRYCSVL